MTRLLWRDAVFSGFRLVARQPLAALSWALVFLVGGTLMAGFQVWAWQGLQAGQSLSSAAVRLSFGGLAMTLMTTVVAGGATLRAAMRRDESRTAWPRFGGDELRLLALVAPIIVLSTLIAAPFILLFQQMRPEQGSLPSSVSMWISAIALTLAGARLVLAAPMTLADGRLRLRGALRLTRGLHARLASIFVCALLLSIAIEWAGSWSRDVLTDALGGAQTPVLRASSTAEAMASAFGASAMASRIFGALVHTLAFAVQVAPIGYVFQRLTDDPVDQAAIFD